MLMIDDFVYFDVIDSVVGFGICFLIWVVIDVDVLWCLLFFGYIGVWCLVLFLVGEVVVFVCKVVVWFGFDLVGL